MSADTKKYSWIGTLQQEMYMITLFLSCLCFLLFVTGYYFGKQMGQTQQIRTELAEARTPQSNAN